MTTRSDSAEFLRSLVEGDYDANDRYEARLDQAGWVGFPRFLATAFFLSVERRFTGPGLEADIVRFVADLRATSPETALLLDPQATESVIRAVLDEDASIDLDQTTLGKIQTMVIYKILSDERLSPVDLDSFLAQVEDLSAG